MAVIYDLLIIAFLPFLCLRYALRGRVRSFCRRLLLPQKVSFASAPLWLHAVSVGEVIALGGLVNILKKEFSNFPLVITTITPTGFWVAKKLFSSFAQVCFLPLDLSFLAKYTVERFSPRAFIALETEIWPQLYRFLKKKNIPLIIVNGRLSQRSFKRYQVLRFFLKKYFEKIDFVFAKDELSRRRFVALGVAEEKTALLENLKFIPPRLDSQMLLKAKALCAKIKKTEGAILLAASTHRGEEEKILAVFLRLKAKFASLKLIVCPRHIERAEEIKALAKKKNCKAHCLSQGLDEKNSLFILDKMGELLYFYAGVDIVFMGGSLVKWGGHNIIEPAFLARPVVFGPYMDNFAEESEYFLKQQAALRVNSELELENVLEKLVESESYRRLLGQKAQQLAQEKSEKIRNSLLQLRQWIS